jgi:hypothetical protein
MIAFLLLLLLALPAEAATTLLPPGKMCLDDANGNPLTGGTVNFYVPSTTTPKTTWRDANQISANTNPVVLDSAGCAVVYGEGVYRQVVKDSLGNLVWDQLTADTSGAVGSTLPFSNPGGRLTLQSGVPIMSGAGLAGAAIVYYTPYNGNNVEVYNGSVLVPYTFAEILLSLDATNSHVGYQQSGKNFDLYIVADTTVAPTTLRLCSGPAWSTDTVRSGPVDITYTTYGFLANFSTITCRFGTGVNDILSIAPWEGTYVGTIRAVANGQTSMVLRPAQASGGNPPLLYVFNQYNRVSMTATNRDSGAPYTYSTSVYRVARGSANNVIQYVYGDISDGVNIVYAQTYQTAATAFTSLSFCIGVDTTGSCFDSNQIYYQPPVAAALNGGGVSSLALSGLLGFHTIYALEWSTAVASFDQAVATLAATIRM